MYGRRPTAARCRFKGDNDTFGDFPSRLQHILSHTITHVNVECVVFPVYEVRFSSRMPGARTLRLLLDEGRAGLSCWLEHVVPN
jgi:hypothetical protein